MRRTFELVDKLENSKLPEQYWGHDRVTLTHEHIEHLLEGKTIVFENGEYTTSLELKHSELVIEKVEGGYILKTVKL